jgi:hypothetical protein
VDESDGCAVGSKHLMQEQVQGSSQGNRFFRAHLLTAKARNARIGVHLGNSVNQGQRRHRTVLDTGAAAGALFRICVRPKERSLVDDRLKAFVAQERFSAEGGSLKSDNRFIAPGPKQAETGPIFNSCIKTHPHIK